MKNTFLVIALLLLFYASSCSEPVKIPKGEILMFYNVENLFDTINDPLKNDEDFLPKSSYDWNTERYIKKINDLSKVISSIAKPNLPVVIGLAEIENELVLKDLVKNKLLKKAGYKIIWKESPDERGIDCALLYNPSRLKVQNSEFLLVENSEDKSFKTRDIVYVKGKINNEEFHIFINHWPSRRGGVSETDHKRALAARKVKFKTDSIFGTDKNANIIIMGDLNDEPSDESISKVLGATSNLNISENSMLVNLMYDDFKNGLGTHINRGDWNVLDNIIVSRNLVFKNKGLKATSENGFIFHRSFMEYVNEKGEMSPNRTYGKNYYGGISDHFPVYMILK